MKKGETRSLQTDDCLVPKFQKLTSSKRINCKFAHQYLQHDRTAQFQTKNNENWRFSCIQILEISSSSFGPGTRKSMLPDSKSKRRHNFPSWNWRIVDFGHCKPENWQLFNDATLQMHTLTFFLLYKKNQWWSLVSKIEKSNTIETHY